MNFATPPRHALKSHEAWVAEEAQRMKWQRDKLAQRRNLDPDGYLEADARIRQRYNPPKPPPPAQCIEDGCERKPHARGRCNTHAKAYRRSQGLIN